MLILPKAATIFKGWKIRIYLICMNMGISLTRQVQKVLKQRIIIMLSLFTYNLAQSQPERHVTILSLPTPSIPRPLPLVQQIFNVNNLITFFYVFMIIKITYNLEKFLCSIGLLILNLNRLKICLIFISQQMSSHFQYP